MTLLRSFISKHKLASILLVGIAIRVVLMPVSAHPFDVWAWYSISTNILHNGPLALQGFPPLWYDYMMVPVAYVYSWLVGFFPSWAHAFPMSSLSSALNFYPDFNVQYVPGLLFNFVVKFPFLISDVLVALVLYKTVLEFTQRKGLAEKAALLWFLNPFVIWISAGWGMWDTTVALFTLAGFYLLLKKRVAFAAVCLSLGVASKLSPTLFLVPFAIYIFKSGQVGERWRNIAKFFSVFAVSTGLLLLPYIGVAASFFSNFFVPQVSGVGSVIANPTDNPLGFGLTYWSLYGLNRLINLPITEGLVSFVSALSMVLVVVFVSFAYWRTSKMSFQKPIYELSVGLLFSVFALFLSYRIIPEQFFIWALPFLVVLCVGGQIRGAFYWGASLVALLYAVLNCPLPFFFLPLAPWASRGLLSMVYSIWSVDSLRIVVLSALGCVFSVLLILILKRLLSRVQHSKIDNLSSSK